MSSSTAIEYAEINAEEAFFELNPYLTAFREAAFSGQGVNESWTSITMILGSGAILENDTHGIEEQQKRMLEVFESVTRVSDRFGEGWIRHPESTEATEYSPFGSEILSAIYAEPVEDGYSHPAEEVLRKLVVHFPQKTSNWLYNTVQYETNAGIVASILKCLGRLEPNGYIDHGLAIAEAALKHHDVEVRDAAVQMLEEWGSEKAVGILDQHLKNEEVDWLRDYIESVLEDLKGA